MIKRIILFSIFLLVVLVTIFLLRDPTMLLMMESNNSADLPSLFSGNLEQVSSDDLRLGLKKGASFLLESMGEDGWEGHPGITAICLRSLAGLASTEELKPAIDFLLSCQADDGGFAIPFSISLALKNYTTSVAVIALAEVDAKAFADPIERGKDFLLKAQLDEEEGVDPDNPNHGGFGYGMGNKADLSNTHLALEALKKSGVAEDDPVFVRAQSFLQAAQDREGNSAAWTNSSGGFVYSPEAAAEDPAKNGYPYGAMSFAGLKSLILTGAKADDPRVKDVMSWIEKNYEPDLHPGKGQLSIFYYFATLATTLDLSGIQELKAKEGDAHNWHKDVALSLLRRQRDDGSWINTTRKYMEGLPALASAYALMALKSVDPEELD